ncbi:DUF4332 domain-containing protein [Rubripirellula reticaptiva]|uniref:DUF4332 domain-containing protein n=1 Tax=Rubripirellula reticaptiva TaxID=2528013 RepID=A0A5C6F439_9BACT|nr:DUF4332 domain-containing protein [Rubripirellula reticaptiva]TWU55304.1 hypothetical protein Poly59_16010 [Rubripirellula reticaptiva]
MLLRSFLRLFSSPTAPKPITSDTQSSVVLYAQLPKTPAKPTAARQRVGPRPLNPAGSHRERLLSMRLEHIRICSPRRCERLLELGIVTAGDLASADPERLASHFSATRKAHRMIQHYRRAIRFAASVPGMMPRDALLLVSIHRRSVRGLAAESAGTLYRDLQRFAESSQGQVLLRGRRLPSTRRLKRWIHECESMASQSAIRTRVA